MEGVLFKLGGGALGSWQKRFCKIVGTELRYYDAETADEAKYKGSVELSQSEVHDRGAAGTDKPCFSIEGRAEGKKGGKEYFFHTKDNADKFRWVTALMRATGHPLYNYLTAVADPAAERQATLERLAKSSLWNAGLLTGANEVCADCEAPLPTWAVVSSTTGVVICIECVGVHRNLWAGSCKEVQLDHWRDEDVALLAARGNAAVNAELEACVPLSTPKPVPHSSRAVREAFIAKKYHRAFITTENATTQPPPRDGAPVPRLDDSRASISVPPKYIGVAFFVAQRLVAAESSQIPSKPHLVLANGFQFVTSSKAGDTVSGDALSVQWNEGLQIGIDDLRRPLTLTITEGAPEKMLVKATFPLVPKGYDPTEEPTPITIHGTDSHHKTVTFHGLLSFSSLT